MRWTVVASSALLVVVAGCGSAGAAPAAAPVTGPVRTSPPSTPDPVPPSPTPTDRATPTATPSGAGSPSASATPTSPPPPSCADLAASLTVRDQVGQLLMIAVSSAGLTSRDVDTLQRTRAGSVLLLGNSTAGRSATQKLVRRVRKAAKRPHGVGTLLAADQEGGLVQRLRGKGFDRIPAATTQAGIADAVLQRRARTWGKQLRAAGIDADLAPVADVVPKDLVRVNQPIGQLHRGYGPSPKKVAEKVTAFTRGMESAGVATAVKHFPGLGRVTGNTDFVAHVVDSTTTRHDPALAGFAAGVTSGADMVMVSSAYYAKIDATHRAAFSSTVITGMLRGDLGFSRVVISDDLSAAAMKDVAPGDRMLRFVRAGGDLAIVADPAQARAMAKALVKAAADDPKLADRIRQSAARVLALKARRGLVDC